MVRSSPGLLATRTNFSDGGRRRKVSACPGSQVAPGPVASSVRLSLVLPRHLLGRRLGRNGVGIFSSGLGVSGGGACVLSSASDQRSREIVGGSL